MDPEKKNHLPDPPPTRLPWGGYETPHAVIEVNQRCNISCHGCYKDKNGSEKPIKQVLEEIDFIAEKRQLASLTIAGGEPTLYERLPEVISHIAKKGIRPTILTNGQELTPEKLKNYKIAGLARINLHIDTRQGGRNDFEFPATEKELNELRNRYVSMAQAEGLGVGLCVTLYKDRLDQLNDVIDYGCSLYGDVVGILFTNYSENLDIIKKNSGTTEDTLSVSNRDVIKFMKESSGILPTYYLPSSHNEKRPKWIIYTTAVTRNKAGDQKRMHFDPKHRFALQSMLNLQHKTLGRHSFDDPKSGKKLGLGLFIYAALSFSPKTFINTLWFLIVAALNRNLRLFSPLFQEAPNKLADGSYETCFDCPDATVRNQKIIPVCLVDQLEPLESRTAKENPEQTGTVR